jgi:hypothetical protein
MSLENERVLNLGADADVKKSFVAESAPGAVTYRATDPVISPTYSTPGDFAAQYPTPLDPTEILDMCEEITLLRHLKELRTGLKYDNWREMTSLDFNSGSTYLAFADGYCPEEYEHDGENTIVTLKNLGAKKSLGISDIMHSNAVAMGYGDGISAINFGFASGEGLPGGMDMVTYQKKAVADLKEKEIALGMSLVADGWDNMIVNGDSNDNSLEFDGIENWATNKSCTMHTNSNTASGTFSASSFDRFLSESCAKPQEVWGHPQAIQEMMSGYFQLGYSGSQLVNFSDGNRITPGFNFGGVVNTGVGTLRVVADSNFRRTNIGGGSFQADLWTMRVTHNGDPLVYLRTQIPLSLRDLVPGCTAISFEIWTKTALVIKACCAQGQYQTQFTGRVIATCAVVG